MTDPPERPPRQQAGAISAILKRIAWKSEIERPNCLRSLAYLIESSSAPWANPMARAAVWARAVSRPEVA